MAKDKEFEVLYKKERLRRVAVRKQRRRDKKGSHTCCPKCGYDTGGYVGLRINPYFADMHGEIRYERMCHDCYSSAAGDI